MSKHKCCFSYMDSLLTVEICRKCCLKCFAGGANDGNSSKIIYKDLCDMFSEIYLNIPIPFVSILTFGISSKSFDTDTKLILFLIPYMRNTSFNKESQSS